MRFISFLLGLFILAGFSSQAISQGSSGDVILLLHGQTGDHSEYDALLPVLSEYRTIIPDRHPGKPEARDYWDLLETESVTLIAHSSGAEVAKRMFLMHPERVKAIISIDSSTFGKIQYSGLPVPDPRFDDQTLAAFYRNEAALDDMGRLADYPSDFNTARLTAFYNTPKETNDPPNIPSPKGHWVTVPLLIITAGRGRVGLTDPEVTAMLSNIPNQNAEVLVVKNSGHWVHMERPELVNPVIAAFLKKLGTPGL